MRGQCYGIRACFGQPAGARCWTVARCAFSSSPMVLIVLASAALVAWIYLVFARGEFWLCRERDYGKAAPPEPPPSISIVVPARNEAESIAESVTSLLAQDYPAAALVLVDDDSDDGTADTARRAARQDGADRLTIVTGTALPPGWTGKL